MNKHARLVSSGMNSHFPPVFSTYQEYILAMRDIIKRARIDLTPENEDKIIDANSPKEFIPESGSCVGILLIHGLFDSPHVMHSLFEHFSSQGYHVRVHLLPGHGTRPGDLLDVNIHDFIESSRFAIRDFKKFVEKLIVVGFSTGAGLGIYHALKKEPLDGLITFAPAIRIKNRMAFATNWHRVVSWRYHRAKWFQITHDEDYAKYQSIPFNAVYQVYRLTQLIEKLEKKTSIRIPQFLLISADDEVVDPTLAIQFHRRHAVPGSRIIQYRTHIFPDMHDIQQRCSHFPGERILDFSHGCMMVSPSHPHYGRHGDFTDMLHYQLSWGEKYKPPVFDNFYSGAITIEKLEKYTFKRLTYNPGFSDMVRELEDFIQNILSPESSSCYAQPTDTPESDNTYQLHSSQTIHDNFIAE